MLVSPFLLVWEDGEEEKEVMGGEKGKGGRWENDWVGGRRGRRKAKEGKFWIFFSLSPFFQAFFPDSAETFTRTGRKKVGKLQSPFSPPNKESPVPFF